MIEVPMFVTRAMTVLPALVFAILLQPQFALERSGERTFLGLRVQLRPYWCRFCLQAW